MSSTSAFQDNGLVVRDPDSLTLVLLGKEVHLDISVADDQWHHVAITWSSQSGNYVSYRDGVKKAGASNLEKGQVCRFVKCKKKAKLYTLGILIKHFVSSKTR